MQRHHLNGIEWLEFDLLKDIAKLKHQLFLRKGGCSEGKYASLNVAPYVGDHLLHVEENLRRLNEVLEIVVPHWRYAVNGKGVHGASIALVDQHSKNNIESVDGLMTAETSLSLKMQYADCQIAFMYDPVHHAIANIHSGWRGSVANIYSKAIQQMRDTFGTDPANLLVGISPGLGPEHAEFINFRKELPESFWQFQVRPNYFDFRAISEQQLLAAGILPHHLEIAYLCTFENKADFFSYRRDKITGRQAACITLCP